MSTDAARQLAARRKRAAFACAECGARFETIPRKDVRVRYCSPKCLMRARRKAHRAPAAD